MTLTDLKNQHATDHGFTDWQDLRESVQDDTEYEQHWYAVCVRAQEQALSNAATNAKTIQVWGISIYSPNEPSFEVNKNSITNKQNLVQ